MDVLYQGIADIHKVFTGPGWALPELFIYQDC
jgi:hypothetical protein